MTTTPLIDVQIRHNVLIRASPERVYDTLANVAGWDGWFTNGSRVDPRPGGEMYLRWENWGPDKIMAQDTGRVIAADRPSRFAFQWHPDQPDYPTTVEFELQPGEANTTILRLRESGYQDTPSGRAAMLDCAAGWGEALTLLKFYLEHGLTY